MLYIVGTPLGNLQDLSLRQAETISQADLILAEDTRSAGYLIQAIKERFTFSFNQNQKLISYYKEKEFQLLPKVIAWLNEDLNIVLISESGMPLISDPGSLLVQTCVKKNIPLSVIPGPTAFATAIVSSGFNSQHFSFFGFLPKKKSHLFQSINRMKQIKEIDKEMIFGFYESPKRINETLRIIDEAWPEAEICIGRELTKKFEEIVRGKAKEIKDRNYKGEITVIIK